MTSLNRLAGLFILVSLASACSSSDSGPAVNAVNFMPPSLAQGIAYSPSAMEALSRGLAAITPPGAALQDVYYEFDSIDLKEDAEAILKKNADWLKANPTARLKSKDTVMTSDPPSITWRSAPSALNKPRGIFS